MSISMFFLCFFAKLFFGQSIDVMPASTSAPALLQLHSSTVVHGGEHKRFLCFWAVSSRKNVISLVQENVHHLRHLFGFDFDVYLAHYDLNQSAWAPEEKWYSQEVRYSAQQKGYKFQLAQSLFKNFDLDRYDWIWLLDEDVDVTGTNVSHMFDLADQAGSLISIPTFTQLGETQLLSQLKYPHQLPNPDCMYRYTNFVEVIFPFVRPKTLRDVLYGCQRCLHRKTSWGLNQVWCNFAAGKQNTDRSTACALIDATPVIHRNFRTLSKKYALINGHITRTRSFRHNGMWAMTDVRRWHPGDFVHDHKIQIFKCVTADAQSQQTF
jgi:hypothetical protein